MTQSQKQTIFDIIFEVMTSLLMIGLQNSHHNLKLVIVSNSNSILMLLFNVENKFASMSKFHY